MLSQLKCDRQYLLRNEIKLDKTWQIDGRSGKSGHVEFSVELLRWFGLAALKGLFLY